MRYCCKVRRKLSNNLPYKQAGLGLATAIFVITVMAFLAVIINQLVKNNAETTAEEMNLIRSFYAAESGVQLGLNDVFPPDGVASDGGAAFCPQDAVDTPTVVLLPKIDVEGLNECTASVKCYSQTRGARTYYTIESTGSCGDVSRTIQVRAQ